MPYDPEYYQKNKSRWTTPEEEKKRAKRHKARRMMIKAIGEAAAKGKDVDHKVPLSKGGGNTMKNLRLKKPSKNRSYWK